MLPHGGSGEPKVGETPAAQLIDEVSYHKRLVDGFSAPLDQLIRPGFCARATMTGTCARYRARRDRLLDAAARRLPELEVGAASTGVHVVLHLPTPLSDVEITRRALEARIRVAPLSQFCIERTDLNGLVIGYPCLHEDAIDLVVRALAASIYGQLEQGEISPRVALV